jgi:hypothetical protein
MKTVWLVSRATLPASNKREIAAAQRKLSPTDFLTTVQSVFGQITGLKSHPSTVPASAALKTPRSSLASSTPVSPRFHAFDLLAT